MTKDELAVAVSEGCCSKNEATAVLDKFIETVTSELKKGQEVRLPGFGIFTTSKRKARTGRNPKTGATIDIPASTMPKFKPGKGLKEAVN